jgi:8-oxo-dGTP pyrophosphatase MutT (NUDIX family)
MRAMAVDHESADVKAAGGVVRRSEDGESLYAVAHRPRYDDWSFPKGKLDPGESWEDAARREVREEIGLRCRLGRELSPAEYQVDRGRKVVRYWLMEPESGAFAPNEEVDEVRWLSPDAAQRLLSHDHDRALLREVTA